MYGPRVPKYLPPQVSSPHSVLGQAMLTELLSRTHIKSRHYDEEDIQPDVRYKLEQQRRKQNDKEKWISIYKILFPGATVPNSCMHLHRSVTISMPSPNVLVVFADSKDISQLSSTHLPPELEDSTPHLGGHQEIMAVESIVEDVQNTSSTSGVPLTVTNNSGPGNPEFFDNLYAELDEVTNNFWLAYRNSFC